MVIKVQKAAIVGAVGAGLAYLTKGQFGMVSTSLGIYTIEIVTGSSTALASLVADITHTGVLKHMELFPKAKNPLSLVFNAGVAGGANTAIFQAIAGTGFSPYVFGIAASAEVLGILIEHQFANP